jgi:hypothetical protein
LAPLRRHREPTGPSETPGPLERAAVEVAVRADSPASVLAHTGTYRHFCAWLTALHGGALPDTFGPSEGAAYLEVAGPRASRREGAYAGTVKALPCSVHSGAAGETER